MFFHCEEFFLRLAEYLDKMDEASDYIDQEVMACLIRPVYRYQKIMLAEGSMAPQHLYPGFGSDLSTDWEQSSEGCYSEAAKESVDESHSSSQKIGRSDVNADQHQPANTLTLEQNSAEVDAILAEVMAQKAMQP